MSTYAEDLRRIAQDQNSEQDELTLLAAARYIDMLETEKAYRSWEGQVDRQGGSLTPEEMDPMRGWK